MGDSSPIQQTTSPPATRPGITPRASAPAVSGPVTGGALFSQRVPMGPPRQSGLNRRAGAGMKLSGMATPDHKSPLAGVFGSDFNKWSEIVYLLLSSRVDVAILRIPDFSSVARLSYILRESTFRLVSRFLYDL